MHRMYRAETESGAYAVKILNPEVMSRPDSMANYARAEAIEALLEANSFPAAYALTINGRKMQEISGHYLYIFPWLNAKTVLWHDIKETHCRAAGNLLGRLHKIALSAEKTQAPVLDMDIPGLIETAKLPCPDLHAALIENKALLETALLKYNAAAENLPACAAITNGDMDCKNVMWDENGPTMIDLECLDRGNPVSDLIILSLSWAGGDICQIAPAKLDAFLSAYSETCTLPDIPLEKFCTLGYSWLNWLNYNVKRAAGVVATDPDEIKLGLDESMRTILRINHIYNMKETLLPIFSKWSK